MTGTIHDPGVSQDEMSDLSERVATLEARTDTADDVGPAGKDGMNGKDAIQPRFTVGTVSMGDQPSVSITGELTSPVIDFVMPKPVNGEDGTNGKNGADGSNGSTPAFTIGQVIEGTAPNVTMTGTQLEPVLNFVLKSGKDGKTPADGKDGSSGKSAYQSWLDLGNSGTEQQFIDSLKASPGKDGTNGTNGSDGSSPTLGIGTVMQGAQASASLSGTALNPTLNLVLPKGADGKDGKDGSSPNLQIGSVTQGASASASISGTQAEPRLNLVLQKGEPGKDGVNGTNGTSAPIPSASPVTRPLNTAFQLSATRPATVYYGVDVTVTALLVAGSRGTAVLEYADNAAMTTNLVQAFSGTSGVGGVLNANTVQTVPLNAFIPAGKYVRIRTVNTAGSPTFAYSGGQEVLW